MDEVEPTAPMDEETTEEFFSDSTQAGTDYGRPRCFENARKQQAYEKERMAHQIEMKDTFSQFGLAYTIASLIMGREHRQTRNTDMSHAMAPLIPWQQLIGLPVVVEAVLLHAVVSKISPQHRPKNNDNIHGIITAGPSNYPQKPEGGWSDEQKQEIKRTYEGGRTHENGMGKLFWSVEWHIFRLNDSGEPTSQYHSKDTTWHTRDTIDFFRDKMVKFNVSPDVCNERQGFSPKWLHEQAHIKDQQWRLFARQLNLPAGPYEAPTPAPEPNTEKIKIEIKDRVIKVNPTLEYLRAFLEATTIDPEHRRALRNIGEWEQARKLLADFGAKCGPEEPGFALRAFGWDALKDTRQIHDRLSWLQDLATEDYDRLRRSTHPQFEQLFYSQTELSAANNFQANEIVPLNFKVMCIKMAEIRQIQNEGFTYQDRCYDEGEDYQDTETHSFRPERLHMMVFARNDPDGFQYFPNIYKDDDEIALQAAVAWFKTDNTLKFMTHKESSLKYTPPRMLEDKHFIKQAVAVNGLALQYAGSLLRDDPSIVLSAVRQNPAALEFAGFDCQHDRRIVAEALFQERLHLFGRPNDYDQYAGEISQETAAHGPEAYLHTNMGFHSSVLKHASPKLRADVHLANCALQHSPTNLQHVNSDAITPENYEMLLKTMFPPRLGQPNDAFESTIGSMTHMKHLIYHPQLATDSLKYAPDSIRSNFKLMSYVAQHSGNALRHMHPQLTANPVLAKLAVRQNGLALRFVHRTLKARDPTVVNAAVENQPMALEFAVKDKLEPQTLLLATRMNGLAWKHVPYTLRYDEDLVLHILQHNPDSWPDIKNVLQQDQYMHYLVDRIQTKVDMQYHAGVVHQQTLLDQDAAFNDNTELFEEDSDLAGFK